MENEKKVVMPIENQKDVEYHTYGTEEIKIIPTDRQNDEYHTYENKNTPGEVETTIVQCQNNDIQNREYHTYGTEEIEIIPTDRQNDEYHTYDETESRGMHR